MPLPSSIHDRQARAGDAWSISPLPSASVSDAAAARNLFDRPGAASQFERALAGTGPILKAIRRWTTRSAPCRGSGCQNASTSSSMRWQSRMNRRTWVETRQSPARRRDQLRSIAGPAVLKFGPAETFVASGAMSPGHTGLCRLRRLAWPAHLREKPSFSTLPG